MHLYREITIMSHVKVGGLKSSQIKRFAQDHQAWRLPKHGFCPLSHASLEEDSCVTFPTLLCALLHSWRQDEGC